jgi:hypothetical protein
MTFATLYPAINAVKGTFTGNQNETKFKTSPGLFRP